MKNDEYIDKIITEIDSIGDDLEKIKEISRIENKIKTDLFKLKSKIYGWK